MEDTTIDHEAMAQQDSDAIDHKEANRILTDNLQPAGSYRKVDIAQVTDDTYEGRDQFSVYGPFVLVGPDRQPKEGATPKNIRFKVSWIRVNKTVKDDQGRNKETDQPDRASLLWAQTLSVFKAVVGQEAETRTQVRAFLEQGNYGLSLGQYGVQRFDKQGNPTGPEPDGQPGNYVRSIFAIRE